jgi:hypothetical protein
MTAGIEICNTGEILETPLHLSNLIDDQRRANASQPFAMRRFYQVMSAPDESIGFPAKSM